MLTSFTPGRRRAAIAAATCAVLFVLLGFAVEHHVPAIDRFVAVRTFATIVPLAIPLTELGTFLPLVKIAVASGIIALVAPAWRKRIIFSLVMLLCVHLLSDATKTLFDRARPEQWLAVHETSYSYPSGHAATATAFFALWGFWIFRELSLTPRLRAIIGALFFGLAYGMCWSRLVLGAHWLTDILGGILLGLTVVYAGHALIPDVTPSLEVTAEQVSE